MSWSKKAYAALKSRTVVKTLQSGRYWECKWAIHNTANKKPLEHILQMAADENPCVLKALQMIKRGGSDQALTEAFAMMVADTRTCTPPAATGNIDLDAESLGKEVDAEAVEIRKQLADPNAASLIETGTEASVRKLGKVADLASARAVLQASSVGLVLFGAIAFIVMLLLVMVCVLAATVIAMVIGLVLCILRSLIYGLLSIFKLVGLDLTGEYSFGGCIGGVGRVFSVVRGNATDSQSPGDRLGTGLSIIGCAASAIGGVAVLGR